MISFFKKDKVAADELEIASIWSATARQRAAAYIAQGQSVGIFMGTVCALFGKGDDESFFNEVVRVKGEKRLTKPLGVITNANEAVRWLDPAKIPTNLHWLFLNPAELASRFGGLCFLRLPVRKEVAEAMPGHHFSYAEDGTPIIMILDPYGYTAVEAIKKAVHSFGVKYFTGTSMNYSGQVEIVRQIDGINFCREVGQVPLFLTDPTNSGKIQGSLPIIRIDQDRPKLLREGFIPTRAIEKLLGAELEKTEVRLAAYPQMDLGDPSIFNLTPYQLRHALLKKLAS